VVIHGHRFRRENRHVNPALFHDAQLIIVDAVTDLIVGDGRWRRSRRLACALKLGDLLRPEFGDLRRCGGEVTVAIDNHV